MQTCSVGHLFISKTPITLVETGTRAHSLGDQVKGFKRGKSRTTAFRLHYCLVMYKISPLAPPPVTLCPQNRLLRQAAGGAAVSQSDLAAEGGG